MKKKNVNQLSSSQSQNRELDSFRDEFAETKSVHDVKRRKRIVINEDDVKTIDDSNESTSFSARDARKKTVNAVIVYNDYIY